MFPDKSHAYGYQGRMYLVDRDGQTLSVVESDATPPPAAVSQAVQHPRYTLLAWNDQTNTYQRYDYVSSNDADAQARLLVKQNLMVELVDNQVGSSPTRYVYQPTGGGGGGGGTPPAGTKLGINVSPPKYSATDNKYANLLRSSRQITSLADFAGFTNTNANPVPSIDAAGWPIGLNSGQTVKIILTSGSVLPAGVYTVQYTGTGTFKVDGIYADGSSWAFTFTAAGAGTQTFTLTQATRKAAVTLTLLTSDSVNYVTVPGVWQPGYYGTGKIFTDPYLASLSHFDTLRFMDWTATNGNPQVNWTDRTSPSLYSVGGLLASGCTWESLCELVNASGKNAWINVPDQATDDYVAQLAAFLGANLRPDVTLHVEYSNELWNTQFDQYKRMVSAGLAAGLDTISNNAAIKYIGRRAGQVFAIFRQNFPQGRKLMCLLMSKGTSIWDMKTTYAQMVADGYSCDGVGGTKYFYQNAITEDQIIANYGTDPTGTLNTIFSGVNAYISGKLTSDLSDYSNFAASVNKPFYVYEGGQSLVSSGKNNQTSVTTAYNAANVDPRMGTTYDAWWAQIKAFNTTLLCAYDHIQPASNFGSWGAKQYIDDADTVPKWAALMRAAGVS